jgi:hypothetical protein
MKRVLLISPHFPPVNAPDMQRIRVALPHWIAAGWEVTVLTAADPTPAAPVEPELLATVPAAVRVERVFCPSRRWTGLFGVGNVALRVLPFLWRAGCRLLAGRRYDVVYFSTTQFSVLPLGRLWRMLYGVPFVVDLQDPWVSDYYDRPGSPPPPGGWKYRFARGLGRALEGWTLRGAAHLIVVSAAYAGALRSRHPELTTLPATELPFGPPDSDLQFVRTQRRRPALLPPGAVRLAFAGALGPGQLAAVGVLFAALAGLRRGGREFSVHFFGTSYAPAGRPATLALAAAHGLQDCVHEQPARLGYFDSLQVTLDASANLLFGSTDLPFTPSKLLAVLAAGRPVIALAPAGSAMAARLASFGAGCITFPAAGPVTAAVDEAAAQLAALAAGRLPAPAPLPAGWHAAALASRQLDILAAV